MKDLITIVVPVYNVQKYLNKCVKSIVNQSYENLEIILVNDCSKDKSGQICDKWANKDKRIKVVHKEINQGLSSARNTGISLAKGKYIRFVDSDDWLPKKSIEILYSNLFNNSADFCQGKAKKIVSPFKQRFTNSVSVHICNNDSDRVRFSQNVFCVWLSLYSMEIIRANGIRFCEDVKMYEDSIFNCSYAKYVKKGVIVDSCVYNYNRLIMNSMSRNNSVDYEKHLKHTLNTYLNIFDNNQDSLKIDGYNNYIHTVVLDLGRRIVEGQSRENALEQISKLKQEFLHLLNQNNLQLANISSFLKLFIEGDAEQIYNYLNVAYNNKKAKLKLKLKKMVSPFLRFCVFKLNLIK